MQIQEWSYFRVRPFYFYEFFALQAFWNPLQFYHHLFISSHDRKSKNDQCVKHSGTNDFIRCVIMPADSNTELCDEKVLYELQLSEILKLRGTNKSQTDV
ncbi:hypothetical protein CGI26_02595 [Vibrio parahaemolyticus]|nr:hypothetical protein CGI26_02595 [Vibrio parahaemolyticus]